jgi:hypothetical protein
MIYAETIPGMEEWRRKVEGVNSTYIWYIVRTLVNDTMYPHPEQ